MFCSRLNAFVVKVFTKGIDLGANYDAQPICFALEWLLKQQIDDGSFVEKRPPYHREMTVSIISMLQKYIKPAEKVLQQEILKYNYCILTLY